MFNIYIYIYTNSFKIFRKNVFNILLLTDNFPLPYLLLSMTGYISTSYVYRSYSISSSNNHPTYSISFNSDHSLSNPTLNTNSFTSDPT